jgi:hypothetical protein
MTQLVPFQRKSEPMPRQWKSSTIIERKHMDYLKVGYIFILLYFKKSNNKSGNVDAKLASPIFKNDFFDVFDVIVNYKN